VSTSPPFKHKPRTDPESALAALKRARKRAEELAAATGTAVILWKNGQIVRIYPRHDGTQAGTEPKPG
jgi:hypothetical protein